MTRPALSELPAWPAALNVAEALKYTRLSETELRRRVRDGEVRFLPVGTNGEKICQREELDALLRQMWAAGGGAPLEDMDFGNG